MGFIQIVNSFRQPIAPHMYLFFKKMILAVVILPFAISVMAQQATQTPSPQRQPRPDTVISNNGLKGNLNAHDPCMIKAGDTYYVLTTGMGIKASNDMVNWVNLGLCLTDRQPFRGGTTIFRVR